MPRVIYLIALERDFNNAIFENQVKRLLLRIKREHSQGLDLTLVVLLPWIELTRRGAYSNFRRYKSELKSLQRELSREGIRLCALVATGTRGRQRQLERRKIYFQVLESSGALDV